MIRNMILVVMAVSLLAAGCGAGSGEPSAPEVTEGQFRGQDGKTGNPDNGNTGNRKESGGNEEASQAEHEEEVIRDTEYGPVKGTIKDGAFVWYGVPYGKEPSGELRWEAPREPHTWTEAYDATGWKEPALQLSGNDIIGTEDCLNLDIYSTGKADKLPVMVFLHGGNNQTGNTKEIIGTDLVKQNDMVFVSVNYRLGLLGFNCLPSLQTDDDATGNYALLDIAKALDWVKNNIEEFGGDSGNITISGFSAGGRDVMAMLISPLFEGKFQKAIVFSGGMTVADEGASASMIARAIAPLVVEDNMAGNEAEAEEWLLGMGGDVKEYLYGLSSGRLAALMGNAGIRMSVFPHLYADGVVLPKEGFDTQSYNDVPLLMLTGTTEFSMFAYGDSYFTDEEMSGLSKRELEAAKDFAIRYGSRMYGYFNAEASAERMKPYYESPVYLCSINYGDASSQCQIPVYGAFHGIFVPMLAKENNYAPMMPGTFDTPAYEDMAGMFNRYLRNFLHSGNPNGDGLAQWEAWQPETHLSMVFDAADDGALAECRTVTTTYGSIMDDMDSDQSIPQDVKDKVIRNVMNGRWFSEALDRRYNNKDLWE